MKSNIVSLGKFAGLHLTAEPSALVAFLLVWVSLAALGLGWLNLALGQAIVGGLVAAALHWDGELIHNLGHAWAARRTGFPMKGVHFWGVLGTSVYPRNEPELPKGLHIRRALGGPLASLGWTVILGITAYLAYPLGGAARWVSLFAFLDNLFIFTLGAFLPLPFTDGGTLLRFWGKE